MLTCFHLFLPTKTKSPQTLYFPQALSQNAVTVLQLFHTGQAYYIKSKSDERESLKWISATFLGQTTASQKLHNQILPMKALNEISEYEPINLPSDPHNPKDLLLTLP